MKRSLKDIEIVSTSHNIGKKRVLLAVNESGCLITQVAITELQAGDNVEPHVHNDMQEGFYVMSGVLDVALDDVIERCQAEDFVWVKCGTRHELRALTEVRIVTIGCEVK